MHFGLQNFLITIICAELEEGTISIAADKSIINVPSDGGPLAAAQDTLNLLFTVVFAVELVLNLYANWFKPFFTDGWCLLDLVIVGLSLVGLAPVNVPVSLVLCLRAIRVIRLFGKIRSLRKMLTALTFSIPPMMNAFVIILIIACICESRRVHFQPISLASMLKHRACTDAIISVNLFRDNNPVAFGSFSRAFISMFQITGCVLFRAVSSLC